MDDGQFLLGPIRNPAAGTDNFIQATFFTRHCFKYIGSQFDKCVCNRKKNSHSEIEKKGGCEWSYRNNTERKVCDYFGQLDFEKKTKVYDHMPNFIRFDCIEPESQLNISVYRLLTRYWQLPEPSLIISINGGNKQTHNITHQQKKNFKQGLMDVIKKNADNWDVQQNAPGQLRATWIIGSSFNVGISKLIGEVIYEYNFHHDVGRIWLKDVILIGICTWGAINQNETIKKGERKCTYLNEKSTKSGKVCLDGNYDCFLFCDDGTECQYDKEVEFRLSFEQFVKAEANAHLVQVLFEGGTRALINTFNAIQQNIPTVIMKGSGRAADLVVAAHSFNQTNVRPDIEKLVTKFKKQLKLSDEKEIDYLIQCLVKMATEFRSKIVVHGSTEKLGKHILIAIIKGLKDNEAQFQNPQERVESLSQMLRLAIKFSCPEKADEFIFNNENYEKMSFEMKKSAFILALKRNEPDFVQLILDNNFEIRKAADRSTIIDLYEHSRKEKICYIKHLLEQFTNNLMQNDELDGERLMNGIGRTIRRLSGNILMNEYKYDAEAGRHAYGSPVTELFLWALLSDKKKIVEIFWRVGEDHVSTALIASTILTNINKLISLKGESDLIENSKKTADQFQNYATMILKEAYKQDREKSMDILIRPLDHWNKTTCIDIAIGAELLEFLNCSACQSYLLAIWRGKLRHFIGHWKITLTMPIGIFVPQLLVSYFQEQNYHPPLPADDAVQPIHQIQRRKMSNIEAIREFYSTTIVKFMASLVNYVIFLIIFAYMNLIELRPLKEVESPMDMWSEIFVYLYFAMFIFEELRQIYHENRTKLIYKMAIYFSSLWNKFDVGLIFLFLTSISIRFAINEELFVICRCLFALTLSAFCLRMMQFYFASRTLGPQVLMIKNMIRDLVFFLSIFGIFLLAYGLMAHAITKPNADMNIGLFRDIFYLPYFQMYGELMLSELLDYSVNGSSNSTCDTSCMIGKGTVGVGFAIYLLLTNIMLLSLLIAMFGFTFNTIQERSAKFWSYMMIVLVREFYNKPVFPPPFNIFQLFCQLFYKLCRKRGVKDIPDDNLLYKTLSKKEADKMAGFERLCLDAVWMDLEEHDELKGGKTYSEYEVSQIIQKLISPKSVLGKYKQISISD